MTDDDGPEDWQTPANPDYDHWDEEERIDP